MRDCFESLGRPTVDWGVFWVLQLSCIGRTGARKRGEIDREGVPQREREKVRLTLGWGEWE
jgi:hypothetical protein